MEDWLDDRQEVAAVDAGSSNARVRSLWRGWWGRRRDETGPPRLRFAGFELETDSGRLSREGTVIHIQPQPARALQYLAERSGRLVTRDELRRFLWGEEHFVNFDQGLNYCIQQIRLAVGDSAQAPRFLETLPRKGYRFLVPVVQAPATRGVGVGARRHPLARWWVSVLLVAVTAAVALGLPGGSPRLAVVPLPASEASADGALTLQAARALADELGRRYQRPLGPGSTSPAGATKADLLLETGVVRQGDHLEVSLRLLRARDQVYLWVGRYGSGARGLADADWLGQAASEVGRRAGLSPRGSVVVLG